ncbi:N-succinylarginine dihydrolase [Enterobacteriaceae bacterium BIT-l23]|uniref:N-succinylarginine dihydrolase n=1 Tax=Jejubacter sp. L23 TaxID=3092086 RepID=UPI0015853213|nr:N-succinylarginine dihydrolase [Enterobacteriaceae bacterium BIT-l23]
MNAREANFDGLVGPTHHYAGLSLGNEASMRHRHRVANPRLAARQGLLKMKALADAGFLQGVIPPQERPGVALLRQLGFSGNDGAVLEQVWRQAPGLLEAASSASAMWVANAATVSPSADSQDGRVHFTVANLNSKFHRAVEARVTGRALRAIFGDTRYFEIHNALPQVAAFADEGAANHNRLAVAHGAPGIQIFVWGRGDGEPGEGPKRYPARQTLAASQAVARLNRVASHQAHFVRQNPEVIDCGVFHNDVIAVSNQQLMLCHERAFVEAEPLWQALGERLPGFQLIEVPERRVSVADAVQTYLFNSQLLTTSDGGMTLVLPEEARRHAGVWEYLNELLAEDNPITRLRVFDLRESMANGGGPACLRLRVVLNEAEQSAVNPGVWMNEALFNRLDAWIERHYRDRLIADDLRDPQLLEESRTALDELTGILSLGALYDFQREVTA